MLRTIKLFGVTITAEKEGSVLEYVIGRVSNGTKKLFITTPNPEILVYASSHPEYKKILNEADIALPDGIGIIFGAQLLGKQLRHRISGVDFMKRLCEKSREKPMSMGFLGGRGGVAERAIECLKKEYPWIKASFIGEEWGEESSDALRHSNVDILFVAYGAPKQEEWIYKNLSRLPIKAAMGVGGAFDYVSGDVKRAPKFVRALGFEWLFRLVNQPWRIKRQLALIKFITLLIKESAKQ